jgi:type IV conjugative transfer system protein TraE
MIAKKYISTYKNTLAENRFFRLLVLGLLGVILLEAFLIVSLAGKTKVVVVPATVTRKFFVEAEKASVDYIEMMAEYAVNLLNTYTPKTAEIRRKDFLALVAPSAYHTLAPQLLAAVKDIIKFDMSSVFIRQEVKVGPDKVAVVGIRKKWMGKKLVAQDQIACIIHFKIHQGRFEVVRYEEMDAKDYYHPKSKSSGK